MKRNALLCGALLAACGGGNKNTVPSGELGAVHDTNVRSGAGGTTQQMPAPKPDPATEFRMGYSDPGGMWMPAQMTVPQHTDNFQKMGVKLDAAQLADPLKEPLAAVVSLGGCTASLVSPEGLIVTNHHCVQGSLQLNSTPEKNYQVNGFLAKTKAEELPAGPAQHVMVLQAYRDVTKEMRDGLDKIKDPIARKEESEKRQKELVHACETGRPEPIRPPARRD
jgi:hypothetical protein